MGTRRRQRPRRRLFQGRMRNRRTGRLAPRLYGGGQRRGSHRRFGTQASPYGAGGGGRSQVHVGHAGNARNVIRAGVSQAQRGSGMNMGLLHRQNPFRGSRQLKDYRNRLSRTGRKAFRSGMTEANKFKLGSSERRNAVRQAKRDRSDARRGFADTYRNPYTGTSHRRVTTGNRRSERTGRRTTMAIGFGGRRSGRSGLERIQRRRKQLGRFRQNRDQRLKLRNDRRKNLWGNMLVNRNERTTGRLRTSRGFPGSRQSSRPLPRRGRTAFPRRGWRQGL